MENIVAKDYYPPPNYGKDFISLHYKISIPKITFKLSQTGESYILLPFLFLLTYRWPNAC